MTLAELAEVSGWEILLMPLTGVAVTGGYTSDLLSDVMAHCPEGAVLITVQNHQNSVAVCTLVGAPAILVVHRREVPADMLAAAQREGIALLRTPDNQFNATVKLAKALAAGGLGVS